MKTLPVMLLLAACMTLVLVGCSDNSSSVVGPNEATVSTAPSPLSLGKGAVVASATGNANMYIPPSAERTGMFRTCEFNAREYADGSYSGTITNRMVPGRPSSFKAEILQLKVDGNLAKMVFRFTQATGSASWLMGLNCCYVVADNGEGANAVTPDMNTWFWEFDPSETAEFLSLTPQGFIDKLAQAGYPGLFPTNNGNVQVWGNSYQ